jgi:formiminoglutamase
MKHFKFYSKEDILSLTKVRRFETKMGERVKFLKPDSEWPEVLKESAAKYVILGIPEDFGVKANYGTGGTETAWLSFLAAFLNVQSNDYLTGENILVLGILILEI